MPRKKKLIKTEELKPLFELEKGKKKEKRKSRLFNKIAAWLKRKPDTTLSKKIPLTFNVGLAIILFFIYLSILFVVVSSFPAIIFLILPTLYILVKYIKLERETYEQRYG